MPENEHAARAYLELCKDTVLDQNRRHKKYTTTASGIITFGLVLLGIGFSLALQTGDGPTRLSLLGLLGAAELLVVVIAWRFILGPVNKADYNVVWAEANARHTASRQPAAQTLVEFAEYYRKMIDFNRVELHFQEIGLQVITYLALFELGVVIIWSSSL